MQKLTSYVYGQWIEGKSDGTPLYNAVNGDLITHASTEGIDMNKVLEYGREKGGKALRKMTFQERGLMLKKLALFLMDNKDLFYGVSFKTGATKIDSWIDIEGGIGNVFSNASLRRQFPDTPYLFEGDIVPLSKKGSFIGQHLMVPKQGIAIHINAYNFPVWGMLEKVAVNWLAGVPAVVKPATVTSYLTQVVVEKIIESKILPEGALQLLCGSAGDLLDHVINQDVITFTGSASTGQKLKTHPRVVSESVPFNMEADSLNASVLGTDVEVGSEDYQVFIKEVSREMTVKAGQKCTAIRRILVPSEKIDQVQADVIKRLEKTVIGDPLKEEVRMGSLAGKDQLADVMQQVEVLATEQEIVYQNDSYRFLAEGDGSFMAPILMRNDEPKVKVKCHEVEAFGPVATIMPYESIEEAAELCKMGKGSLVSSIITSDVELAKTFTLEAAAYNGRIVIINKDNAKESTGHGSPLPLLVHGGPGRAGGGEEMGGVRGVKHYLQRTALQGTPTMLSKIGEKYLPGADRPEAEPHVFRQYFEDLNVGDTVYTHKHTVTVTDIVNFANVSGDNFYAHMDETSLEGTLFEQRVAHGYFILSKAAGLFVEPRKGPVLLNYGIEEARFTKPVYPGSTIGVKCTVKEKIAQEKRDENDIAKGIVKYYIDVYDETGETVAVATILTMVKMRNQD